LRNALSQSGRRSPLRSRISATFLKLARRLLYQKESAVDNHARPSLSWGGARLRSDRASDQLSQSQATEFIAAAHRAQAIGLPFNRFVTVHWQAAGLDDPAAARATGRLLKLAADWARAKQTRIAWAWSRENDKGDGSKGSHVHILLHCPADLPIGKQWRRWIRNVTGLRYRRGAIRSLPIGRSLNCYANSPDLYRENLIQVVAYCVKGVTPEVAAKMGLPKQEDGGRVIGKRSGHSQNLGAKSSGS